MVNQFSKYRKVDLTVYLPINNSLRVKKSISFCASLRSSWICTVFNHNPRGKDYFYTPNDKLWIIISVFNRGKYFVLKSFW